MDCDFGGERVRSIATGGQADFAVTESGVLFSWGFPLYLHFPS
jgi:hypothetical protein